MTKQTGVREKILTAAVKLLGDCGIRKLAQPQIAKKAGVPQGHMTYYFPTRSHLLIAVAERSLESVAATVMKKATSMGIKARDSLSLVLPLIKNKSRTRMLIGLLVESDENPELRAKLKEQMEFSQTLVALALKREPADSEVNIVHAALLGFGIQYYLDDSTKSAAAIDNSVKYLIKNFGGK